MRPDGESAVAEASGEDELLIDVRSFKPALGSRMDPDSARGEAEARGIGKVVSAGELKEVGGADPEE
jgi:hypothetical protein